jgi:hypothetical protein
MNWKQKLLTVLAMIAFGLLIALHYVWLPYYVQKRWRPATVNDFDPDAYLAGRPQHTETVNYPGGAMNVVPVPGHWSWEPPLPFDLRNMHIPLFALSVFYTGFFFLLASRKVQ